MADAVSILKEAIALKESQIEMTVKDNQLGEIPRANKLAQLKDQLSKMVSKLAKMEKPVKSDADISAEAQASVNYYLEFLAKHDYRYVKKGHCYVQTLADDSYTVVKPASLREAHPELSTPEDMTIFKMAMEQDGRIFAEATKSFRQQPPWILNLLSRDKWVLPEPGAYNELFDILGFSIGGGKTPAVEHIEKVFRWKYLHPEEVLLPAIVIFGEGEVGKNLFIEKVMKTIFGDEQVSVLEAEHVLGNFNGLMAGRALVFLNECVSDNVNMERFKAKVGQNQLVINEKYGLMYTCDSTAWVWTGGNGVTAGVKLANDKSDRRWSIIRVTKSLIDQIATIKNLSQDEAFKWFEANKWCLSDREQCSHWLYHILDKWKGETVRPLFLDGEDRAWLLNVQRRAWQGLAQRIFNDTEFKYINTTLLYLLYKWFSKEFQPAVGKLMSDQQFFATIERYLELNHPEIKRKSLHVVKGDAESTKQFFAHDNVGWKVHDNDFKYCRPDDRGNNVFILPEE